MSRKKKEASQKEIEKHQHAGHRARLRKRFRNEGLDSFETHNALELLLFFSLPQKDTNELAHKLIEHFGSFEAVFDAPYTELIKVDGIGEVTATLLKLVPQISGYYLREKSMDGTPVCSIERAGALFIPRFVGKTEEQVQILSLDAGNNIIRFMEMPPGNITMAVVNIRKIIAEVMANNAVNVIVAHNHVSTPTRPSFKDKYATKQLHTALKATGVRLLDHIIVSDNEFTSMRECGGFIDIDSNTDLGNYGIK